MSTTVHLWAKDDPDTVSFGWDRDHDTFDVRANHRRHPDDAVYVWMDDAAWEALAAVVLERDAVHPIAALRMPAPGGDTDAPSTFAEAWRMAKERAEADAGLTADTCRHGQRLGNCYSCTEDTGRLDACTCPSVGHSGAHRSTCPWAMRRSGLSSW